jgi:hypothetical protein
MVFFLHFMSGRKERRENKTRKTKEKIDRDKKRE